jgi:hypothetical protein
MKYQQVQTGTKYQLVPSGEQVPTDTPPYGGVLGTSGTSNAGRAVFAWISDQLRTAPLSSSYAPSFLRRGTAQGTVTAAPARQSSWLARTAR